MATAKILYTDPEIATLVTKTVTVLATKGWGRPDDFQFFPALQHRYLSGDIKEQFAGFRRRITIDFGVVADLTSQKQILYFLLDPDRQIQIAAAAPSAPAGSPDTGGGTLPADDYYYVVTAVDGVGETVASAEGGPFTLASPGTVDLTITSVAGIASYRIYRSLVSGNYGATSFLVEVPNIFPTDTTYSDTGGVSLSQGTPPTAQVFDVALEDASGYANQWLGDVQIGAKYVVTVLESAIRTTF